MRMNKLSFMGGSSDRDYRIPATNVLDHNKYITANKLLHSKNYQL